MSKDKTEFEGIINLIKDTRNRIFSKANAELIMLYYNIGYIVSAKVSQGIWGQKTVDELAGYILENLPELSGFNRRGLYRMKQFYETYNQDSQSFNIWNQLKSNPTQEFIPLINLLKQLDFVIVSPTATQLQNTVNEGHNKLLEILVQISWTNHLEILPLKSVEEKLYYLLLTVHDKLTKTELRRQIKTSMYERSLIASKNLPQRKSSSEKIINIFKDPYIFEFLNLPDFHSESELEKAILKHLQTFILELGKDFTYVGNQYNLRIGNRGYRTDLLFYHRGMQCLVLFELKMEEFDPEFLGKLNFYLEALDRDVRRPSEKPSIGILLCKGKDSEVVEYAQARNSSPSIIAEYETKLIDKKVLSAKLHQLVKELS